MSIRVLLADDEELVRTGLRLILEAQPDLTIVGEASNGLEAVQLAGQHQPDVVLMDVRMPVLDGIAATAETLAAVPSSKVIILTTFDQDEHVFASLRAGASGFLLKDSRRSDLVRAVREVAAGQSLLSPAATRQLIAEYVRVSPHVRVTVTDRPALTSLSEREQEVLTLVARGMSNAEIAADLTISEYTVKTHVGNILAKLTLRDRVQAVIFAYENGLVGGTSG